MPTKLSLASALLLSSIFHFPSSIKAEVAVTIYNQNLALVREVRQLDFPKGVGQLRFTDVASEIIPTSVHFTSDKAALLEQNYEYDLVSSDKLLEKYIDQRVEIVSLDGKSFFGSLLSSGGDIVLRLDGGTPPPAPPASGGGKSGELVSITRSQVANVRFPELPEGLITRPTLVWLVDGKGGKSDADISYLTRGISWESEYVAVSDVKDENLSLTGWVNITNNSGATYKDARLKLMAGDVNIEQPRRKFARDEVQELSGGFNAEYGFQEQAFYEYHLYTLQRPSTIADKQVKQVSLFPTASTPVKKEFRLKANEEKVTVVLEFENREKVGLGIPLPKGKVRVYKQGPDGGQEFIGEDNIDHTPKDEKVRITTGKAFDIVGERKSINYERQGKQRENEIVVRNHKKETIEVVIEDSFWGDWKFIEATDGWEKKNASLVEWKVKIKPDGEAKVRYKVYVN